MDLKIQPIMDCQISLQIGYFSGRPYTGRTHQIRVHLQYLGYPILNDTMYNSEVWGPERGKGGITPYKTEQEVRNICSTQLRPRVRAFKGTSVNLSVTFW